MEKWRNRVAQEYQSFASHPHSPLRGSLVAKVSTVIEMTPEDCQQLQKSLERMTGKHVIIENNIDPSIIAGMVISTSDVVIDMSMASRLQKLSAFVRDRIRSEATEENVDESRVLVGSGA